MKNQVTLKTIITAIGLAALSSVPAAANSCKSTDTELRSAIDEIDLEMGRVAARFPGTTAGLISCAAVGVAASDNGRNPEAGLLAGGLCVATVCLWLSDFDSCMEASASYFLLAIMRSDKAEQLKSCGG